MLNQFLNNFKAVIFIIICYKILIKLEDLWVGIGKKWYVNSIGSLFSIKKIVSQILIYILFAFIITIQQEFNFIQLINRDNQLSLVIGVLTLYGIFYAFIQFAIGYASENKKDKHWGRSKTKHILTNNIKYRFLLSNNFKLLLIVTSIFPFIRINRIMLPHINIPFFQFLNEMQFRNFISSFWEVSMFVVFTLYIALFIKSLLAMKKIFKIQEESDDLGKEIEKKIIRKSKNEFIKSYKNENYYFFSFLVNKISSDFVTQYEKKEMLYHLMKEVINEFINLQEKRMKKIKEGKRKIIERKYQGKISQLTSLFNDLWNYIKRAEIRIEFEKLINLYKLQNSAIFNQIFISNSGNEQKIMKHISSNYIRGGNFSTNHLSEYYFFEIPRGVWESVTTYGELTQLNNYIINRRGVKELIKYYNDATEEQDYPEYKELILKDYERYLKVLLDECADYKDDLKEDKYLSSLFPSFYVHKEDKVKPRLQNQIYKYIKELQYNEENKKYIKILVEKLDSKYSVALVFYIMLYTGSGSYSKWSKDVLFLKSITNNYDNEKIASKKVINFVCKKIKNSSIGHRITCKLIKWIINNLDRKISGDIIKKCINNQYLSYAKFLKLKYIFQPPFSNYPDLSDLNLDNLQVETFYDWRISFMEEMLETPSLLREEFFYMHQAKFYKKVLEPSMPKRIYETNDFRLFHINLFFLINEEEFINIINDEDILVGDGLIEFLVLNICEKDYNYLQSNSKISNIFKKRVEKIINNKNLRLEDYVNNLINKANECTDRNLPKAKKKKIILELEESIYN